MLYEAEQWHVMASVAGESCRLSLLDSNNWPLDRYA